MYICRENIQNLTSGRKVTPHFRHHKNMFPKINEETSKTTQYLSKSPEVIGKHQMLAGPNLKTQLILNFDRHKTNAEQQSISSLSSMHFINQIFKATKTSR